jgi:O-antigen ligase
MLFWLGLAFVVVFPLTPMLGAGLIGIALAILPWSNALSGRGVLVNGKDLAFLAYILVGLVVTVMNAGIRDLGIAVRLTAYPWAVSFLFQNLWMTERRADVLLKSLMAVALLLGAVMLFQVAPGRFDFSPVRLFTLDRQEGFYFVSETPSGPNVVAYLVAAGIAAGVGLVKAGRATLPVLVAGGVLLVFLVVSGGRMAWVAVLMVLLVPTVFDGRGRPTLRFRRLAAGLFAISLVVAIWWWASSRILAGEAGAGFEERLEGIANPTEDRSFAVRASYWAAAVQMFLENPAGHGFNAYYERFGRTAHNEVLGQLVATGWHGTLMYFGLLGVTAFLVLRAWRRCVSSAHSSIRSAAVCCGLVVALAMLTEHVSRAGISGLYMIFWILVGAALARYRKHPDHMDGSQPAGDA